MSHSIRWLSLFTAVLLLTAPPRGYGQSTSYWDTSYIYPDFGIAANWIGGVPGGADTAAFTNNPSAYQGILWSADATVANAVFSSPDTSYRDLWINYSGNNTWFVTNRFDIAPNPGDTDSLRMINGGNLVITNASGTASLNMGPGASLVTYAGTLTVDRLVSTNNVGLAGIISYGGTMNILNGADLTSSTYLYQSGGTWNFLGGTSTLTEGAGQFWQIRAGSTATVSGPGTVVTNTAWLGVGVGETDSQLIVTNGGRLYSLERVWMGGSGTAGRNKLTVTGNNSLLWSAGQIYIGLYEPSNTLVVANGGTLEATYAVVGLGAASTSNQILVSGQNSLLRLPSGLFVGVTSQGSGSGSVLIHNGGTVETTALESGTGGSGSISNIGGVYQFTTASPTVVAGTANGVMIENGTISFRGITNAPVDQTGTQLTNITFQGNNAYRLVSATNTAISTYTFQLNNAPGYAALVLDNGRFEATDVTIDTGASLSGNGTVAAATVTNLGTISPGFSAGELTITGNLVLASSSLLQMEIGGTNSADYDRILVGGDVSVDGALSLAILNAFSPTPGQVFTLIDNLGANAIAGQFDGLTNNAFIDASANGIDAYFRIQYDGGTGNDLVLIATVPEPSTFVLVTLAVSWLMRFRKLRQ